MRYEKMQITKFLVRIKPLPSESLSSWRQRSAWENGYRLFPILDERRRRVDPDRTVSSQDEQWLSEAHEIDSASIAQLALSGPIGKPLTTNNPVLHPPWWIRARYPSNARQYGGMFCPKCLNEDQKPYFRLHWRFGFITSCEVHKVRLLDACPKCQCAPWPRGSGFRDLMSDSFTDFRKCWHCGIDNSGLDTQTISIENPWNKWFQEDAATFGLINVPVSEALSALRAICQLFLRNRSRMAILKSENFWSSIAFALSSEAIQSNSIEQCRVGDREILVSTAMQILSDWPTSFRTFAQKCSISRFHFSGSYEALPKWLLEEVDTTLAKHNRNVTPEIIAKTIQDMKSELGRRPFKGEVRRRLNWEGAMPEFI